MHPGEHYERYLKYSPVKLVNKKSPEVIIHGKNDDYIPVQWSRDYVSVTGNEGNKTQLIELESCGHMDFLETGSTAFKVLLSEIQKGSHA